MMGDEDGSMVCTDHPFKNSSPGGGICAFCLQEKLGKLVSSSFPIAVFPASSSSHSSSHSPSSFRSASASASDHTLSNPTTTTTTLNNVLPHHHHSNTNSNRSNILYLLSSSSSTHHKNKKNKNMDTNNHLVFKRSKSTVTPRKPRFMDTTTTTQDTNKRSGFWSFLSLQRHSHSSSSRKTMSFQRQRSSCSTKDQGNVMVVMEENESPSFDRKVSRSRSVGCGSRSFSGDLFDRISTGFGDCTLRRVESQREGGGKQHPNIKGGGGGGECNNIIIKERERVRCGGLFSGFMITGSSSSSNSSSSSYWVPASSSSSNPNIKPPPSVAVTAVQQQHSRSKSWGWGGLASPMRAFNKHSSNTTTTKRDKNQTPNLAAIPSLLSVRS